MTLPSPFSTTQFAKRDTLSPEVMHQQPRGLPAWDFEVLSTFLAAVFDTGYFIPKIYPWAELSTDRNGPSPRKSFLSPPE